MTRIRHTEEQIIAVLKDAQAGAIVSDLCRKHGISEATFYKWRTKYAGLKVGDVKKLRQLEDENRRLKQMVAEQALKAITATTLVRPKAKRTPATLLVVRFGLSQRRVCRLVALEDTRDRRDHAILRLPPDLRAAATGRLEGELPEG
jgi:putative transposase